MLMRLLIILFKWLFLFFFQLISRTKKTSITQFLLISLRLQFFFYRSLGAVLRSPTRGDPDAITDGWNEWSGVVNGAKLEKCRWWWWWWFLLAMLQYKSAKEMKRSTRDARVYIHHTLAEDLRWVRLVYECAFKSMFLGFSSRNVILWPKYCFSPKKIWNKTSGKYKFMKRNIGKYYTYTILSASTSSSSDVGA